MAVPFYAVVLAYFLFLFLAVHHFVKAVRGLRTGNVEGLMLGYWNKRYCRNDDRTAFWVNIIIGMLVAALGVIAVLWGLLIIFMMIAASEAQPTL